MSRCYPYPPPGYEKKAQPSDLILSAKNEKRKHKDKKKRKDVTANGDTHDEHPQHEKKNKKHNNKKKRTDAVTNGHVHDKEKQSSKHQQTAHGNQGCTSSGNVGGGETAAIEHQVNNGTEETFAIPKLSHNSSCYPLNRCISQNSCQLSSVCTGFPSIASSETDTDVPCLLNNSLYADRHIHGSVCSLDALSQPESQFAFDDLEWLFPSNRLSLKPKEKPNIGDGKVQVWAEAVYLSSIDMFALPYVAPY
ncbi:hypothetical protein O6H91_20G005600 [Diphasiastrum complanatum]|uniref:Uncharacterized protein n=1 Tax=Diphasiastrum complanatum TaxID=34168 RepID=A0ACC2AMF5_DIPCM|nr:hypothetical protein O6H91_Y402300 [Diphasiastrum complanatum]KAJ7518734.1 hypothetical protein O6H91_20G005600 [Diphasiastrum complanatum]